MKLTKKQAKELSLKKWKYFVDHPKRYTLPKELKKEFLEYSAECPLCTLFILQKSYDSLRCEGCPLMLDNQRCLSSHSWFSKWYHAEDYKRKIGTELAKNIYNCIKDWKIEKE